MGIQPRKRRSGKGCLLGIQRNLFHHTAFGGLPFFQRAWKICRVDQHLRELGIVKRGHPAELLAFAYVAGNLLGARTLKRLGELWNRDGYLSRVVAQGCKLGAHNFSRFLPRFEFQPLLRKAVGQLQSWDSTGCCPETGILILDATVLEKTGRKMQGARFCYDHAKGRFVWGYPVVNLIYRDRRIGYPIDFRLQPKGKGRAPRSKRTQVMLAKELIDEADRLDLMPRAVVFDAGFCALELLRHLDHRRLPWVSRLAVNRVLTIEGNRLSVKQLARKRSWYKDDPVRGVRYFSRIAYLRNYELPVQILVLQAPGERPMVLATSLIDAAWQEIFRLYQRRFAIEVFHRDCKQYLGLTDFRNQDLRRIRSHLALSYLRYLLLELMRAAFPEIGGMSWSEIKDRLIATVQEVSVAGGRFQILLPAGRARFRRLLIRYKTRLHPITA